MDEKVQPLLERLFSPEPLRLELPEQRLLATWATKIALMLDYTEPEAHGTVKPSVHERMYHDQLPPDEGYVWLAAVRKPSRTVSDWVAHVYADPARAAVPILGQRYEEYRLVVFYVGTVVFLVVLPDPGSRWNPGTETLDDFKIPLWPLSFEVAFWPPHGILEGDAGVLALLDPFIRDAKWELE